jgi:hypothetical protein
MRNNPTTPIPVAVIIVDKKVWCNPELILIAKDDIEANNPFAEDGHPLAS